MQVIFLDFESYYDDNYSLKKMTPAEYVLDPRFETIGCAIWEGYPSNKPPYWLDGPDLPAFFASLDPAKVMLVTHNALFDMCIVAWRYGFIPRLMCDTLGVARALLGHVLKSLSLASVMRHLGLGEKGGTVAKVKGMGLAAIKATPWLYKEFVEYAINDVVGCGGIFHKLVRSGQFPISELAVMDMVLRCAIQPQLLYNQHTLAEHQGEVLAQKEQLLAQVMLTTGMRGKSDLMSNDKFASLLRMVGVEPPMKVSPVTGRAAYAFSKTDPDFLDLQEHENPAVQVLVSARLGHKSTLEETRTQRFIDISNLDWPGEGQARWAPFPLRYAGAHTHRLSGDWKVNKQNLTRGGKLRDSLEAPPDHEVVTVDASQIEARLNAWLCGQHDLVQQFAAKADVYSNFATRVFGFQVNKKEHPTERFVGKQSVLGLGYQLGWAKFQVRLKTDSKNQTGTAIELSEEEAQRVVTIYRTVNYRIKESWYLLNTAGIHALATGDPFSFGPCVFEKQAILLPNGLRLFYHDLQLRDGEWWFTYGGKPKKLYGGKLLENMCQALARIHTFDAALRIQKRTGYRLALQAHDENGFVPRVEHADTVMEVALEEMRRRPSWGPDIPLDAEAGKGPTYGAAK